MMKNFMARLTLAVFALFVMALLAVPLAFAQTSTTTTTLSWTPPTQNVDGTALTTTLTYNVYQNTAKAPTFVKIGTNIVGASMVIASISASPCFAVTAVEGTIESNLSPTVCTGAIPGAPGAPKLSVTVSVQ